MNIYIKGIFVPRGEDQIDLGGNHQINIAKGEIAFSMQAGEKSYSLTLTRDLDAKTITYLEDIKGILPRDEKIEELFTELRNEAKTILRSLKHFYGIYRLDSRLLLNETYVWSKDGKIWADVPDKRILKWIPHSKLHILPDNLMNVLLTFQNNGIIPFYAFEHLHKAFEDQANARHQWINATIALELAFKEFLGRLDPRTVFLIENVPSPPLHKLYRDVLKDYTGQESPFVSVISKGVEQRNKLVHKPGTPNPKAKEVLIYLHQCECAILHLYTLLYPESQEVEYFYKLAQQKLENAKKNGYS